MQELLIFILLFSDVNKNGMFDSADKIVEIPKNEIVFCKTQDTQELLPCGYLGDIKNVGGYLKNSSENIVYKKDAFTQNGEGDLYLSLDSQGKWVVGNEKPTDDIIYRSSGNNPTEEEIPFMNMILKLLAIVFGIVVTIILFFPKKYY